MSDTTEPIDLAPFDLFTQKEQVAHLQRWHNNLWRAGLDSKSTKATMEKWHTDAHLQGENVLRPHTHTSVAPKSDDDPADIGPMDLTKPLNASQRKALKDLVENDFLALKAEINQFADDMAAQRRQEINADYAARGADQTTFFTKGRALMQQYRVGCDALVLEARQAGVELKMPDIYSREIEAKTSGLQTSLRAAEADVDADRKRALNTLERARLTAQRKVLMSGVNQEALSILETIPNARSLMIEAASMRSNPELAVPSAG